MKIRPIDRPIGSLNSTKTKFIENIWSKTKKKHRKKNFFTSLFLSIRKYREKLFFNVRFFIGHFTFPIRLFDIISVVRNEEERISSRLTCRYRNKTEESSSTFVFLEEIRRCKANVRWILAHFCSRSFGTATTLRWNLSSDQSRSIVSELHFSNSRFKSRNVGFVGRVVRWFCSSWHVYRRVTSKRVFHFVLTSNFLLVFLFFFY